jgi:hypothetical protein
LSAVNSSLLIVDAGKACRSARGTIPRSVLMTSSTYRASTRQRRETPPGHRARQRTKICASDAGMRSIRRRGRRPSSSCAAIGAAKVAACARARAPSHAHGTAWWAEEVG